MFFKSKINKYKSEKSGVCGVHSGRVNTVSFAALIATSQLEHFCKFFSNKTAHVQSDWMENVTLQCFDSIHSSFPVAAEKQHSYSMILPPPIVQVQGDVSFHSCRPTRSILEAVIPTMLLGNNKWNFSWFPFCMILFPFPHDGLSFPWTSS